MGSKHLDRRQRCSLLLFFRHHFGHGRSDQGRIWELFLGGNNTYTGPTLVNGGYLDFGGVECQSSDGQQRGQFHRVSRRLRDSRHHRSPSRHHDHRHNGQQCRHYHGIGANSVGVAITGRTNTLPIFSVP
ncbi:MAG: hypothetical protein WDN28_00865 [Chthoniobacter sp.]